VAAKGHDLAIEALVHASDAKLLIVGEGPERAALESLARQRGVAARVAFLGLVRHETLPEVYNAADVLLLPSAREGMPNVVLESIACGTRVVATDVGGIAEVLTSPVAGELMRSRSVDALRESLDRVASRAVSVAETRTFAERFAWDAVIAKQVKLYRRVLHG
jgi:glycosyltransferase involved in cell wall biosynthesis